MNPVSRRSFFRRAAMGAATLGSIADARTAEAVVGSQKNGGGPDAPAPTRYAIEHCATEWAYSSGKPYADPFNDVRLDVIFRNSQGREQRVPAYWAGGQVWRIRYAPPASGRYSYETRCSDPSNPDLHRQNGLLEVSAYTGDNPLLKYGPVQVGPDRRHFEHADGTPFFWLGDTWWMGLCKRLRWPNDFQRLVADRIGKGFTVIQIVAGLYPDMPPFDPRGANEAGCPWEDNYTRINPHYFDAADVRIQYLVDQGLMPCIVGCWGYFLCFMGLERMKQHWRYLIARWGAYPVVWCLAGEGAMPYYPVFLSKNKEEREQAMLVQKHGWTEVGRYVRNLDPYRHPVTIHPTDSARNQVEDPSVLDFDMLQTGSIIPDIPNTVNEVTNALQRPPRMPVIDGEVIYEGALGGANSPDLVRFAFWACILSGAAGHTYGANGIWQMNTAAQPFGPSPHGRCWGNTPWDVAMQLPGSEQVGWGKKLLMRYPWWRLEPHPEWVDPHWSRDSKELRETPGVPADLQGTDTYRLPYAAGIPGELRIVFIPPMWDPPKLKDLEPGVTYHAFYFDPASGTERDLGEVVPESTRTWQAPLSPTFADWVLVLEKKS